MYFFNLCSNFLRVMGRHMAVTLVTIGMAVPGAVLAAPEGGQVPVAAGTTPSASPSTTGGVLPASTAAILNHVTSQIGQARQVVNSTATDLISTAMGFLGVPYRRGGTDSITGFDCSGFVVALYRESLGLVLPRTAAEQASSTQSIELADLQPGDLVFFNTMRRAFSHVGVYLGDGKFIHAPRTGAQVRVEDMGVSYWQTRFNGARRVTAGTYNKP
jgi:cell wall-associated NlpC family hydrolase